MSKQKDRGKNKKIALIVIAAVLGIAVLLAGGIGITIITSPANKVFEYVKEGKFEKAERLYKSDVRRNDLHKLILSKKLNGYDQTIFEQFEKGEIDYETTNEGLKFLKNIGLSNASNLIDKSAEIHKSNEIFENAQKLQAENDYENAITEYLKISSDSKHYQTAQTELNKLYNDYANSIEKSAKTYNSKGNYKTTVQLINTAYDILPDTFDTTSLNKVMEETILCHKTEVIAQAEQYVDLKEYKNALLILSDELLKNDHDITTKYQIYVTEYENYCISESDLLIAEYKHDEAIEILSAASSILPNSIKISNKLTEIQNQKPVKLFDTEALYDGTVFWKVLASDESTFSMGSQTYTEGFMIGCDHSLFGKGDGYALFDLQGKYSAIVFDVGRTNEHEKQNVTLQVFLDNELVEEYSLNAESPPKRLTINLKSAQSMKLKLTGGSRVKYGFANVLLIP